MVVHMRWITGLFALLLMLPPAVPAAALEAATADIVTVPDETLLEGVIVALEQSSMTAQSAGRVTGVEFDAGDFVAEGDVIAQLRTAGPQPEHVPVQAPYGLIVTERHIEPGDAVQPGTVLMTGVALESLGVTTQVPEILVDTLRRFRTLSVLLPDSQNERIVAEKVDISPLSDAGAPGYVVELKLPPLEEPLFPGTPVKVAVTTGQAQRLLVPASAISRRGEVTGVYVIEGDDVHFRPIQAGQHYGTIYQAVVSGLSAGERIALDPVQAGNRLDKQPAAVASEDRAGGRAPVLSPGARSGRMPGAVTRTTPPAAAAAALPGGEDSDTRVATAAGRAVDAPAQQVVPAVAPGSRVPPETPAAAPVSAGEDRAMRDTWVINLAAYSAEPEAARRLAAFRAKGVNAELVNVTVKGKSLYRIRATGYRSQNEAAGRVAVLEERLGVEGAWVARYQPGEE